MKLIIYFLTIPILVLSACAQVQIPPRAATIASPPMEDPLPAPENPYAPQPGDEKLQREAMHVSNAQISTSSSLPMRAIVTFTYTLPTVCHQFRAAVSAPDAGNRIDLEFYTLVDPNQVCIMIAPSAVSDGIMLGSLPAGAYSFWINGEKLGEVTLPDSGAFNPDMPVTSPSEPVGRLMATPAVGADTGSNSYAPQPGDGALTRGNVYLDSTDLLTMESYPLQFMLALKGSLPTPCHQLRVFANHPDAENKIIVDVYSVTQADTMCAQVLQPFEVNFPLGSFPAGHYTLWVNGQLIAEFDA